MYRMPECELGEIPLYEIENGVKVRCILYDEHRRDSAEPPRSFAASS
jgi:hypothetical protein